MLRFLFIAVTITLLALPQQSYARSEEPIEALNKTQEQLDAELAQKEALAQKIREVDSQRQETKDSLITTAKLIQQNEANLQNIEGRIQKLEETKTLMEGKLKDDRSSISRLLLSLERIRRTPPEAMLARPETPYKTALSALLMAQLIPSLQRHAHALRNNLETLNTVSADLKKEQENYKVLSTSLEAQNQTLSSLLAARENIFKQTNQDIEAREMSIQKISLQAQNLEDLVHKLKEEELKARAKMDEEEAKKTAEKEQRLAAMLNPSQMKEAMSKPKGQSQLPVSGTITVQYKQKDDLGAVSNGLTIEGRNGALVVAPLSGTIQFAGPFKKYGNIVIIEHENGFHSLVAGLEKIDTLVGEHVQSGEPIGILPQLPSSTARPKLYYELRQNGKPVNPSIKFADLG